MSDDGRTMPDGTAVPEYDARPLLHTETITAWDVVCQGLCRGKAEEEWAPGARIAFRSGASTSTQSVHATTWVQQAKSDAFASTA
jgi:hypothetical protein